MVFPLKTSPKAVIIFIPLGGPGGNYIPAHDPQEGFLVTVHSAWWRIRRDELLAVVHERCPIRIHFGDALGIPGTRKCRIISAYPVDIGDVLFITNAGAYCPWRRHRDLAKRFLPEHYLKARKICSVKI